MYRAYSINQASCDPESYQKRQNDYYFKRSRSTAKSSIDCGSPEKFSHISKFTGSSLHKKREQQRNIDRENLKIFSNMRQTFDSKSPYSQENCKTFELRKRLTTRELEERERVLVNATYVRKIAKSMEMPTSEQMAIFELQTGEKFSSEQAVNLVQRPRGINRKLLLNPNIRSEYPESAQERDFDRSELYAYNKCKKAPVIPELVAIRKTRERLSCSGRYAAADRIGSICDDQGSNASDKFDVYGTGDEPEEERKSQFDGADEQLGEEGYERGSSSENKEEISEEEEQDDEEPMEDNQTLQEQQKGELSPQEGMGLKEEIMGDMHEHAGSEDIPERQQDEEDKVEPSTSGLKAALEDDLFDG